MRLQRRNTMRLSDKIHKEARYSFDKRHFRLQSVHAFHMQDVANDVIGRNWCHERARFPWRWDGSASEKKRWRKGYYVPTKEPFEGLISPFVSETDRTIRFNYELSRQALVILLWKTARQKGFFRAEMSKLTTLVADAVASIWSSESAKIIRDISYWNKMFHSTQDIV